MKRGLLVLSAITALSISSLTKAETAPAPAVGVTAEAAPLPTVQKIIGGIDMRPSWTTKTGEFHTENTILGGFKFTKDVSMTGVYNLSTNLYDPTQELGLNVQSIDLSLRTSVNNVYKHEPSGITVSYENRFYAPVVEAARDKGMVTAIRNYLKLSRNFGDAFKLTVMEVPILHLYTQPGAAGAANPIFENRVYLIGDVKITEKLALSVPLYFHQTFFRDYMAGAKNNAGNSWFVYTYPELTYSINDNIAVAAAYYSDNLVLGDMSNTSLSDGLEKGVFQVSLQASL